MKKVWLFLLCIVVLTGCSYSASSLSYLNVDQGSLSKEIQSYFQGVKEENGVHLYFDKENNSMYVYLNATNVVQGENAEIFTDFDVESEQDTLHFLYKSEETTELSSSASNHSIIYKVNPNKEYDTVKLFNNGNEKAFETISGDK